MLERVRAGSSTHSIESLATTRAGSSRPTVSSSRSTIPVRRWPSPS